ncbi:uncharacterized protein FPRO_12200 [Fusarium proliferatum ET1]|uniref:Uncharacterized protein n=1 Tax=Fusarium proliferatum (strain ET1) TaxID=1227346 RepID=A0A1L7W277_FUSPR|nr:uncharacterized protein FPRO_12200 [Fusarium proliferatum ET1]CZR46749.1 uncharacterized protein FPRO_12200 [Fusarium proliferatum ET1]
MKLQLLLFVLFASVAQAQWKSCSSPWPNITPGKQYTLKDKCRTLAGYPKTFEKANTEVTVTYTQQWSRLPSNTKTAVNPILKESLEKSLEVYRKFAKLPSRIVLTCQIKLFKRWTTEATTNKPRVLQALAHEMYHCVQSLGKLGNHPDPQWVREGSANYFSNLVFPDSNAEWPDKKHSGVAYKPNLPIYAHVGLEAYAASIFFQAQDKMDEDDLNKFVLTTPGGSSGLEERARLSRLSGFTDEFFTFAKAFALQQIKDTNGGLIPIDKMNPISASIQFDKAGTTGTATLTSTSFTISVFKITIDPGRMAKIYSSAHANQKLAYRKSDARSWTDMAADSSSGRTIDLPCNQKDTKQTFIVLFISTKDVKSDKVKITVTTGKPKKCGARSGFVLYPLFNPTTSGGYCPTGTHSSRLAIWCCPDGTQLDEHVAQQVSICCPTGQSRVVNVVMLVG